MAHKLTPAQQALYDAVQLAGSVKKGQGHTVATARVLERRGLVSLVQHHSACGKVHFWRARPVATQEDTTTQEEAVATPSIHPQYVVRTAVRHSTERTVTYVAVQHLPTRQALNVRLTDLGVPTKEQGTGTGGRYTTTHRILEWRTLGTALREFVCAGEVYRIQPSLLTDWEVVMVSNDEVVVAGNDPEELERVARADAAAFHQAMRN